MAKPIECKAAVAWAPKESLKIETITVAHPKEGEVRVKILFASVCHTDHYTLSGLDGESNFPCILGHEGAGIVESIGAGVTSVQVGDKVVPLYIPQCRECKFCKHPKTNLCSTIRGFQAKGVMPDGTSRFSCKGKQIYHYMGTSTFSEYTVMPEIALCKIADERAALDRVCLLACGLSTGFGAALNTANVQKGETVGVFGLGAVGLAVAVGAKHRGASRIIGIDINPEKEKFAKKFGIEFVNPNDHPNTPIDKVLDAMSGGGLDHTFECIGNVDVMAKAVASAHRGWGQTTIIGVAGAGEQVKITPFLVITGRVLKGSAFGGWKSRDSIPKLVEYYLNGDLPVDEFITGRSKGLESLNEVFESLLSGKTLRNVIEY